MLATVIPRGGSAFKAPPPPAVLFGKASTVITDNEREFKTRFKIIESADIIPSHFLQGIDVVINPSYPADLQPRQRDNRLIMRINAVKMADNLRPADLLYSRNLNQGAPVVRNDNVILNGNGRAMALIYAYSKGKANNYRQALIDNAAQFGFIPAQIAKFKAPVLVRKITSPLTDNDIKSIIFSTDGGAKLSPSEQAKTDAEKITPEIFGYYEPNDDGEIGNASNHIFCAAVLNAVCTQNEINGYTCNNATINTDGLLRVKRAVFSAAYNDNNELLLLMTESANNNIKTIGNALFNVAPNVAKLNYRMKAKSAYSYPLAKTLADAAQKISALRQDNQKVQTYLNENSLMPGFDLPVETKIVIAILDANKNSCKAITEFINALISAIDNQGSPSQASLFAFDPEPFLKIIKSAAKDFISSDLLPRGLDNTPAPAKATTPAPAPAKAVDAVKINTADKKIAQEIKPAPQKNSKEITPPAPVIPANNDTIYFSYIASNSKSVTPMFKFGNGATLGVKSAYAELKKRKINLETSYRLLIDAIIYGKAKISADQFGDKNLFWNENLTDKYAAGITPATSNYYSIRNINIVASYAAGLPFAPQFCGTWFKYTKKEIVAKFDAAKLGAPAPAKVSMPLPAKVSTPAPAKVSTPLPENVSTPSPAKVSTPPPAKVSTPAPVPDLASFFSIQSNNSTPPVIDENTAAEISKKISLAQNILNDISKMLANIFGNNGNDNDNNPAPVNPPATPSNSNDTPPATPAPIIPTAAPNDKPLAAIDDRKEVIINADHTVTLNSDITALPRDMQAFKNHNVSKLLYDGSGYCPVFKPHTQMQRAFYRAGRQKLYPVINKIKQLNKLTDREGGFYFLIKTYDACRHYSKLYIGIERGKMTIYNSDGKIDSSYVLNNQNIFKYFFHSLNPRIIITNNITQALTTENFDTATADNAAIDVGYCL